MKSRSIRCMKFFLTLFNIICILFGLLLVTICLINMRDKNNKPGIPPVGSRGVLAGLLALGLTIVVTSVIGCVAALRGNVKMLYTHAAFYIILVSVELLVGVSAAVVSAWMGGSSELRVQFYKNTTTTDDESVNYHTFWDNLQSENQCCGVDGPQDYAILRQDIPTSCCARAYPLRDGNARRHLHATCLSERTYYTRGCEEVLRYKKALKGNVFIATGFVISIFELLSVFLSCWMARTIRSERRKLQANLQAHFET